jgi:ATP phosphoribosyltransferase regulatory subunit
MSTTATIAAGTASDDRAQALLALFERAGYARVSPPLLQPAEPFLDLSGEDIRKRMYLTTDPHGRELCLRPDLTIPVSRDYLASAAAGSAQGFCYLGAVFRHRTDGAVEFLQAGIESFGRADSAAADAEMLALGLEATAQYGLPEPDIRSGDVSLFAALVAALDLAPTWKRRLIKDFNHQSSLAHDLERLTISAAQPRPEYQGVLAALAGSDPKAAHALVTDLLSIAGISAVGGRSVGEIADRFLEQAALGAHPSLPRPTREVIEKFLAIAGDPDEVAAELRAFARDHKVALDAALDRFESRTGFLAARGVDVGRIRVSTAFGRGLDYYSGFVFELHSPPSVAQRMKDARERAGGEGEKGGGSGPLVAGGRYDTLLTRLGSAKPIPAVGFAVWIERLAALRSAP